ncbi:formiminotransferase N-terminal subdomain-containing protein isoform X2 [Xiphophorus hellerii]|uniref:formiminotransferase N-terminal subdomain-containing protein isoform X2 n=1 Tax=Xiphophorus hellerii TaxID=8084 RepID=UPI0013B3BD03|nr:formiminotransferase N-terminal subdomain-containing protein isoform X2 [Xiphophorus hellerii]
MTSGTLRSRLVACLLNVSEARRTDLVENVAKAALYDAEGVQRKETTVLNIFNDQDYNRSVITIVASIDSIRDAVLSACQEACALIDMRGHVGVHPSMGSVDLIPIYPLGEAVGERDCVQQALAVARGLTDTVRGSSVFLFGWADAALQRSLARRRKEMFWFRKSPDLRALTADVGPPPRERYGLTAFYGKTIDPFHVEENWLLRKWPPVGCIQSEREVMKTQRRNNCHGNRESSGRCNSIVYYGIVFVSFFSVIVHERSPLLLPSRPYLFTLNSREIFLPDIWL